MTTLGGVAGSTPPGGGFTYIAAPAITSISPASGPPAGSTSVTITGTNFTNATAVQFGSTNATSFSVNNDSSITAASPAGSGSVDVTVTTLGGTSATSSADQFTFTDIPTLTLTSTASSTTQVGQSYSQTNIAGGGTAPYTYSLLAGILPAGTTLSASTGTVSGTPTTAGAFSYTIKVTDSGSPTPQTATQVVSGTITPATLFIQQGSKLVGTGVVGTYADQGKSVAVSADGNTAIVGGPNDNGSIGAVWVFTRSSGVWTQQGGKLVGTGIVGGVAYQGYSVALSSDGNTAIVGGPIDNGDNGAAWVFTRSGGVWTQQGSKLFGTGVVGTYAQQGYSVAVSSDGNTAMVGGPYDNSQTGAAWVFTRSGGVWTQQGSKLVGIGAVGAAYQGQSVALSSDGNTAIVGGPYDNGIAGAAWVFTRSGGVWTQQGGKMVGTGIVGGVAYQGQSVALSADGNTAIVGGPNDNGSIGAVWVFTRSGGVWTQQGSKLVGTGGAAPVSQGWSVAVSADGNTAIVGGPTDNSYSGAAWVVTRSGGMWTQQGSKLVGTGVVGYASQGFSVALSGDGNTAVVGGLGDNGDIGAAWVFVQPPIVNSTTTDIGTSLNPSAFGQSITFTANVMASGGTPTGAVTFYDGAILLGNGTLSGGTANFSLSSLSIGDHTITATYGGDANFNTSTSAPLTQTVNALPPNTLAVIPATNISTSGHQGGPFAPSSFQYQLSTSSGSANYSISGVPTWLDVSSASGTVTTAATTVTFSVNSNANGLSLGTYIATIGFTNTTNGQGTQTRSAVLTVNSGGGGGGPPIGSSKRRRRL